MNSLNAPIYFRRDSDCLTKNAKRIPLGRFNDTAEFCFAEEVIFKSLCCGRSAGLFRKLTFLTSHCKRSLNGFLLRVNTSFDRGPMWSFSVVVASVLFSCDAQQGVIEMPPVTHGCLFACELFR